jgi:uncharacterized membrane protein YphA (DoxX/SURF4 family)
VGTICLVLRLWLGLALFDAGIVGFFANRLPGPGGPPGSYGFYSPGFNPAFARFGPVGPAALPGWEVYSQSFPYIQITCGLALLLGFCTKYAALLATLWPVLTRALKIMFVLAIAIPDGQTVIAYLGQDELLNAGGVSYVAFGVATIWLSSMGYTQFSIDSLIRRKVVEVRANEPPVLAAGAGTAAEQKPPDAPEGQRIGPTRGAFESPRRIQESSPSKQPAPAELTDGSER